MAFYDQYVPYQINWKLLDDLSLEPSARGEPDSVNKTTMSIMDVLQIIGLDNEYTLGSDYPCLDVAIGTDHYSFDTDKGGNAVEALKTILRAGKAAGGVYEALRCTWYYFETESTADHDPSWDYFFLCKKDEIVEPKIRITTWPPPSSVPQNFLLEDAENYLSNDVENRTALARICYEKWQQETLPGRIYAMKSKMEQERELAEDYAIHNYLTPQNSLPLVLRGISSIGKHLNHIKVLLWVIAGALTYIALLKLR